MSASLVGSEMCIRDSARVMHVQISEVPCSSNFGKRNLAPGIRSSHCAGPVSYTHLTLPTICSV
eukprot:2601374-Alexandrium_andersonii.AAC.1